MYTGVGVTFTKISARTMQGIIERVFISMHIIYIKSSCGRFLWVACCRFRWIYMGKCWMEFAKYRSCMNTFRYSIFWYLITSYVWFNSCFFSRRIYCIPVHNWVGRCRVRYADTRTTFVTCKCKFCIKF